MTVFFIIRPPLSKVIIIISGSHAKVFVAFGNHAFQVQLQDFRCRLNVKLSFIHTLDYVLDDGQIYRIPQEGPILKKENLTANSGNGIKNLPLSENNSADSGIRRKGALFFWEKTYICVT